MTAQSACGHTMVLFLKCCKVTKDLSTRSSIYQLENSYLKTLEHPTGLWSVTSLGDGDIVTAGQDGVIRIWSRDLSRMASDDVLAAYTNVLAENHKPASVGDLKLDQLPGPEALLVPGTKEAQHLMIKKEGKAHLYAWSMERKTWDIIGEIIQEDKDDKNSKGSDNKKMVNGVSYDYVFDVELNDGPNRQLLFNLGGSLHGCTIFYRS